MVVRAGHDQAREDSVIAQLNTSVAILVQASVPLARWRACT